MKRQIPDPREEPVAGIRACMVTFSLYPDDPRVSREARTLRGAGVEVDVICLGGDGQPPREEVEGIRVYRIPFATRRGSRLRYAWQYGAFSLLAAAALTWGWRRRGYDVIHVHSLPDFLVFAAALPRAFGTRVILDLHEAMPEILAARFHLEGNAILVRVARAVERASAAVADEVLVVNDTIRELLIERGISPHKLTTLPNTPEEEAVIPANRQLFADRFGLQAKHTIVVAGGLNPERDLETLIRSIALPPLAGSVSLVLLGRGDSEYVAGLRDLSDRLHLANRVAFGGFVPHTEALSLLSLSDVGVVTLADNPITRLGLPNRLFEYVMLGKPLVVPRLPAIESFVGSGGFYYRPGSAKDLASAIANALSDGRPPIRTDLERRYRAWRWSQVSRRLLDAHRRARPREVGSQGVQTACT